jgi:hypothetical protein
MCRLETIAGLAGGPSDDPAWCLVPINVIGCEWESAVTVQNFGAQDQRIDPQYMFRLLLLRKIFETFFRIVLLDRDLSFKS